MNRIGRKIALFAAAFSVSACIAEASLVTMTFDIEVLSNDSSLSVNGQEIQQFEMIQYTMVLDTSAASASQQGSTSTYSGSIFQGGGVFYNGTQIVSHNGDSGSVSVTNNHSGNNIDEWATQADFVNVVGPSLTANSGSGTVDLSTLNTGSIETFLSATAFSLVNATDLVGSSSDLGSLLESQLATLSDEDRLFDLSWSDNSGNGNNGNGGNNGNAGGNGKGKGKGIGNNGNGNGNGGSSGGDVLLGGRIVGVTVVAVPEPGTYAMMAIFLGGLFLWRRRRTKLARAGSSIS